MAAHSVHLLMGGFTACCRTFTWQGQASLCGVVKEEVVGSIGR